MTAQAPIIGIVRHRLTTDGDGVTTLVAFHTCTLHCNYCLNPQSLVMPESYPLYTPQKLYDETAIDNIYFLATGGGITFGGGEPCLRSDFIVQFHEICGPQWNLSIETALNVPQQHIEHLLPVIHHWIIDIKDMNPDIYHNYTGKNNDRVVENLKFLANNRLQEHCIVRVPLIPEYNTADDCNRNIAQLKALGFTHFDQFTYKTSIDKATSS